MKGVLLKVCFRTERRFRTNFPGLEFKMARSPDPETDPSFSECEAPPGEDANGRNEGEGWCAAVLAETPKVLVGFSDSKALSTGTRVVQALRRNGGRLALAVDEKQDGSEEDEEVEGEDEDEGFLLAPHSPLLAKSGSKPASILGSEPCTRGASPKIETGFQLGNVHDPDNAHEDPLHSFSVDDAGFTHSQMEYLVRADASEAALTTTVEPARVAWRDGTWENDAGSPLCKPAVAHASISRGDSFDASQIEFAITDTQLQLLIEEPSLKSEAKEECTDILAGQRNSSDNSMCVNAVVARLDSAVSHNGRMNNVDDPALNSNYDPGNLATSSLLGESLVPTDNSGYAFEQTGEGQSPITSAGPDLSIDAFAPDFDITATQLQYVVDNDVPPALENESVPLDHGTHAQLDVMEFVEMDILAGETSSLPMKNTKFNVQHSNETCDSTSQNHQREQLEEHFNGPAPANAAISPTPLHAHLPPVPAVPSNSHPNSSPSAKYHRSPREPLSNTSPSPNTHSDPARDARAARTPPLATRRTSKRRRETISGALPDNKRAPPREKVRGEPRRRSLGFDVFRSMARAAAAAGKEEEERLGSADVAVAVWERTPPMGKGKGKRGLGAAARANEKEKGESEEGKARGILGRAKKAKAARDVSVEAGCAGLEMKVPQVLPHEENISEHELLGYLESGAMDLELDGLFDNPSSAPSHSVNPLINRFCLARTPLFQE
ncbi:hypothetical protein BC830DRAFT_531662 [Chytriomyces sp. MP71]|nr:hypothetical protein BC830DRAFT_531662 [Chytriomyces sp. MP71]